MKQSKEFLSSAPRLKCTEDKNPISARYWDRKNELGKKSETTDLGLQFTRLRYTTQCCRALEANHS